MKNLENKSKEQQIELSKENANLLLSFGENISSVPSVSEFSSSKYEKIFPGFKVVMEYSNGCGYEAFQKVARGNDSGYSLKLVMDENLREDLRESLIYLATKKDVGNFEVQEKTREYFENGRMKIA